MKKIMFNDKYGLTQAVLEGRKTQTRRIITCPQTFKGQYVAGFHVYKRQSDGFISEVCMYDEDERDFDEGQIVPKYKVGEIVAVAQSYLSIAEELEDCNNASCVGHYERNIGKASWYVGMMEHPGFSNKMFTSSDYMIHQIRITNVRIQRLQDISDDDCLKEGITEPTKDFPWYSFGSKSFLFNEPQQAYAALIDKVGKKGDWDKNPYVFVYDFELVK